MILSQSFKTLNEEGGKKTFHEFQGGRKQRRKQKMQEVLTATLARNDEKSENLMLHYKM